MPVFEFVLRDTVTGQSRFVSVAADSKEEAEATIMAQELKKVRFELDPTEALALEKRFKAGELTGREKAQLFTHQQTKTYVIQKGKEA